MKVSGKALPDQVLSGDVFSEEFLNSDRAFAQSEVVAALPHHVHVCLDLGHVFRESVNLPSHEETLHVFLGLDSAIVLFQLDLSLDTFKDEVSLSVSIDVSPQNSLDPVACLLFLFLLSNEECFFLDLHH